jgi:hypothetical protein
VTVRGAIMRGLLIGLMIGAAVLASVASAAEPRTHEAAWYGYLRPCEQAVIYVLEGKTLPTLKRKKSQDVVDHRGHWNAYALGTVCRPQGL